MDDAVPDPVPPAANPGTPPATTRPPKGAGYVPPPSPPVPIPDPHPAPGAEVGGRGGLDPTRYGDWEIKGIAVDF